MIGIALKFLPQHSAPEVVASGDGYIGELIYRIGKNNSVPIYQNEELAKKLYEVPVGLEIPEELYKAVATVFAYILKLENDLNKK